MLFFVSRQYIVRRVKEFVEVSVLCDMEKSLKSSVWKYFKICKDDERKADCLLCESNAALAAKQIIRGKSTRSFSTKPLWNHLEWKHPEFHKEAKTPVEKFYDEEDPLNILSTPNSAGRKETHNLQNATRKQTMWSLDDRRSMNISKVICKLYFDSLYELQYAVVSKLNTERIRME